MTELTLRLTDVFPKHLPLVGGKGANLGDLARGLKVTPGFCLITDAYELHLKQHDNFLKMKDLTEKIDPADMAGLEKVSREIKNLILQFPFPEEVAKAIREAYEQLLQEERVGRQQQLLVAVRSSATAEDLADASFAGQQESFLNVSGIENVLEDIKKCWASLWEPRAIHYRSVKGFGHQGIKMAVIVQEMVPAEVAGVMFTANPVNNDREQILIEAVPGLGDALVSGKATGDSYVIQKEGLKLISSKTAEDRPDRLLSEAQIRQLALYGFKIEEYYETHHDVEWAFYKGEFYMLQTRPITTLADEEPKTVDEKKLTATQKEMLRHAAERYPEPVLPLDGALIRITYSAYFNAMVKFGYDMPQDIDWRKVEQGLFPEFFQPPPIKTGWKRFFYALLTLPGSLKRDPAAEWAAEQVYLMDILNKLAKREIDSLPFELIYEYIKEAFDQFHFFIVMRYEYFVQNRVPSDVLLWFLKRLFGEEGKELQENLLLGIPCMTLEMNEALHALAQFAHHESAVAGEILKSDPASVAAKLETVQGGTQFLHKFEELMQNYGERETSMGLGGLGAPNWKDAPEVVYGIIRGMLTEDPNCHGERKEKLEKRRKRAEEKLFARLDTGIWRLLPIKGLIKKFIVQNRQFAVFREDSHYDVTRALGVFQQLFSELGKRFAKRGFLKDPQDILYLTYHEVKEIMITVYHGFDLDIKALQKKVTEKKEAQQRRMARWQTRHSIGQTAENAILGIASSAGLVSGPARVVLSPQEFYKVKQGDILIAPYTNPSWTPLFTTVAGLVVDTGGAASHASIIAREYGIPTVMGTGEATKRIKDGDIITVNGSTGVVLLN